MYGLTTKLSGFVCLTYFAYCLSGTTGQLLDVQRQQLPFGELIFPVPERFNNESKVLSYTAADGIEISLPKITAMVDRHTDDGSVISRHYSATLVESAWRNRLNNSTMAFFLENTSMDVSSLSLFGALYLSAVMAFTLTRKV